MSGNQLSLFDLSHDRVKAPLPSSGEAINNFLLKHWSNSEHLAFCMINVLLCTNELLFEFVEYIKTCRLSEVADEVQRPSPHKRFDRLAGCLKRLEFTRFEHGDKGEVIQTETNVLDFAIDVSFGEKELRELRAFGIAGPPPSRLRDWQRPSGIMLKQLTKTKLKASRIHTSPCSGGFAFPKKPCPDDKEVVLKAMLNGIGESQEAHRKTGN